MLCGVPHLAASSADSSDMPSHRRDCHCDGTPSPSLLKRLLKAEGAAAERQSRQGRGMPVGFRLCTHWVTHWTRGREHHPEVIRAIRCSESALCRNPRWSGASVRRTVHVVGGQSMFSHTGLCRRSVSLCVKGCGWGGARTWMSVENA